MPLPSELRFHALLQYSPRGTSPISVVSREVCYGIKGDKYSLVKKQRYIDYFAQLLKKRQPENQLWQTCFGSDVHLIPVPRSALRKGNTLWPTRRICEALVANGLGKEVLPIVERKTPLRKSSAAGQNRPLPEEHYSSLGIVSSLLLPAAQRITVVDDVVTQGSTLLAVAQLVQETYPQAEIHYFAMVRTMSDGELSKIVDEVQGKILLNPGGRPSRNP